jgi:hypothetical protein
MNLKVRLFLASIVILSVSCLPLLAHHGTGVAYETEKTVTV